MAARTFEDSAGQVWEVFEVRRASASPNGVSAGLEAGWLTFVHGTDRRRLAPFPPDWEGVAASELERMCASARVALSRDSGKDRAWPRTASGTTAPMPTQRAASVEHSTNGAQELASLPDAGFAGEVEAAVRAFAHEARTTGLPAIGAMVQLRSMLLERFPGQGHPARDMRRVRRWFVDAYYFEREA